MKIGDTVCKISGKPFKSGLKNGVICSFTINEQCTQKRVAAVMNDGSIVNLDILEVVK